MKEKNKKMLWYKAGVFIVTFVILSIGTPIVIAKNDFSDDSNLFIDIKDIYRVKVNSTFNPEIKVTGGIPPYNITVYWIKGSEPDIYPNILVQYPLIVYKYNTTDNCTLRVFATDSVGDYHYNKGIVNVYEPVSGLSVSIIAKPPEGKTWIGQGDTVTFDVSVSNSCNINYYETTTYTVYVNLSSPCNNNNHIILTEERGPISPCLSDKFPVRCCQECGPGKYTATATIISHIKDDDETDNIATCTFYIFSPEMDNFFSTLPHNLIELIIKRFLERI